MSGEPEPKIAEVGLGVIVGRRLSSVEFVLDYLQLRFDGYTLTAVTMPRLVFGKACFLSGLPGYRDALYERIGVDVTAGRVEEGIAITITFADGWLFTISLDPNDYLGPEAALFHEDQIGGGWYVW